ncbi:MAG: glycosyltransferase family 4 protein [Candidatus Kerfeldbacteria bacterium]
MNSILFLAPSVTKHSLTRPLAFALLFKDEHEACIAGPAVKGEPIFIEEPGIVYRRIEQEGIMAQVICAFRIARDYDVVVACDDRLYGALAGCLARLYGKRFIYDTGEDLMAVHRFDMKILQGKRKMMKIITWPLSALTVFCRRFAHQVTVSTKLLQKKIGGEICPIPVDVNFFSRGNGEAIRKRYRRPLIVHIGTIQRHKGLDTLVKAFKIVEEKIPSATLLMVGSTQGSPGYFNRLEQQVKKEKQHIHFTGTVRSNDETRDYLAAADCLVVMSEENPIHNVQFPIKLGLSMGARKPIVAARVGSIPDILGDAGVLVDPTAEAVAQGIILVLQDEERATAMTEKIFRRAQQTISFEALKGRLQRYYFGDTPN